MVKFFLVDHLKSLSKEFKIYIFCNQENEEEVLNVLPKEIEIINLGIKRDIALLSDIFNLLKLVFFLKEKKVFAVYSISPKGGLISSLASWVTRVPLRIHVFTGQVWVTNKGFLRILLKFFDKLICQLSTDIIIDSHSQKTFLENEGVLKKNRGIVIGRGSISGVNVTKFFPKIVKVRNIIIFLFVGRLKRDKGVFELYKAFQKIKNLGHDVELWFVGDDEEDIYNQFISLGYNLEYIKFFGYVKNPETYMQEADIFCLPSYIEGFGSAVIEASACQLPTIASRIYGLTDAIIDKKTGFLINVGDVDDLYEKMLKLYKNKNLRVKMGIFAYNNAINNFDSRDITEKFMTFFKKRVDEIEKKRKYYSFWG